MPSILFICTANQFRSPVAAECFRRELESRGLASSCSVESAGTWAVEGVSVGAAIRSALQPLGFDLSAHRARCVTAQLLARFDLLLVMTAGQKEALSVEFPETRGRLFLLSEAAEGLEYDIPDAVTDPRFTYAEVVEQICELVRRGFDPILRRAEHPTSIP